MVYRFYTDLAVDSTVRSGGANLAFIEAREACQLARQSLDTNFSFLALVVKKANSCLNRIILV